MNGRAGRRQAIRKTRLQGKIGFKEMCRSPDRTSMEPQIQLWNSISRLKVAIDVPTNAAEIGNMAAKPAEATAT